jgi:hypothetical protein
MAHFEPELPSYWIIQSKQLTAEYAEDWKKKQVRHCLRFAETLSNKQIVYTLYRQLSWSQIRMVLFCTDFTLSLI